MQTRTSVSNGQYQRFGRVSLALALLLMFAIFGMADSSLATGTLRFDPPLDKLLHASIYGTVAGLMRISEVVRRVAVLWLMVVTVAILDELHQMTIVGREASGWDLLADMLGITLALWLTSLLIRCMLVLTAEQR